VNLKNTYNLSITAAQGKAKEYWDKFVEALKRFGDIVKVDARKRVITITSELNFLTLTGRAKDAVKSVYFGADVSCSRV
jgi:hypothetical protein